MAAQPEAELLQVQMFGGFTLTYGGRSVIGSVKSRESQFIYLMQLVLHFRKRGVRRELLEEVLFEGRDVTDVRHALRSIIYNAKQKLRASGLPDVKYIQQKNGYYYWTEQIPVTEDAEEFERLYEEAGTGGGGAMSGGLLLLYRGVPAAAWGKSVGAAGGEKIP